MERSWIKKTSKRRARGFTLIEVLITLVIVAIGMLGIAALQFRGLQYSGDAFYRSQVNILAYDIADRIRQSGNPPNANAYDVALNNWVVPATRPAGCNQTVQTVANDVTCWQAQVWDALPPGSIADVLLTSAAQNIFTVTLTWTDRDGTTHPVAFAFRPN